MTYAAIVPVGMACLLLTACNTADAQGQRDAQVQATMDRVAIEDMVTQYYAHLGREDAGAFDDYFTQDAVFDVNGTVARGRAEIEALYAGMGEEDASEISTAEPKAPSACCCPTP